MIFRRKRITLKFIAEPPSQGVRGFGGEKPDFLRSENVALCLFTSKAMAVLRWFLPPREQQALKFISIAKNLNFTCSPFPTAKSDILTHPPPLITSAPQAPRENEKRQRKIQTLASCSRTLVGVGAHDDPAVTPQCHRRSVTAAPARAKTK